MFTIQLFSLEINIRKKEVSDKKLKQAMNVKRIEKEMEAMRNQHNLHPWI